MSESLTEFLLARVAEDETEVRSRGSYPSRGPASARRLLADVQAKRRIVRLFPHAADGDGWNNAGEEVLLALAAIYADHPDYREEWKP